MRSFLRAAAALMALAFASSCGGGSSAPAAPSPPATGPVTINIIGDRGAQSFSPNPATVAGQAVVFRNTDTEVHRVRLNDFSLDTGDIAPGATSRVIVMPAAGTNYHCFLHPTMIGAVSTPTSGPPPCTGIYC